MPPYKGPDGRWRYRGVFKHRPYSGSTPKGDNTRRAAIAVEREHLRKLEHRVTTDKMPTVDAFIEQFLDYQKPPRTRRATFQLQSTHLRKHVSPHIGTKLLDDVDKKDLDNLMTTWSRNAMPRTCNTRLGTLTRMLNLAVEWRVLAHAPEGDALKVPRDTVRFLTEAEAYALLESAHPRWRTMILVALRTGMRVGELRGLQWGDINWRESQVNVERSDPGVPGEKPGPPKGGKSRTLPLTADTLAALKLEYDRAKAKERVAATDWVWPGVDIWKDQRNRDRTRSEGGCVNAITAALKAAGIVDRDGDRLGWHTLRHTFASWMVIRGKPLRVVQDLMGHASIRQTERYAHLAPNAVHHDAVADLDYSTITSGLQRALKAPSDLDRERGGDD